MLAKLRCLQVGSAFGGPAYGEPNLPITSYHFQLPYVTNLPEAFLRTLCSKSVLHNFATQLGFAKLTYFANGN